MKRFAVITSIVLLVLSFLVITWRLQNVVYIFLASLVITMTLERPIDLLTARGAPRWLAVLSLYGASLLGMAAIALIVFTPFIREIDPFAQDILNQYGLLENRLARIADKQRGILIATLPTTESVAAMIVANSDDGLGKGLVAATQRLLGIAGELAMAFVIAIYWSMDSTRFERLWLSLLPPARRTRVRRFLGRLERSVGAYVRSEILQTLLAGTLLTALYALIGIPYPFLLATLIALTWLIPILGGAVALIVAVLVGWFASWSTAVMAGGATLLVLALMEYIVQPRLYRGQRYWGILTVILMLALGDAFGLIGVLVAPPIALILQMLIDGFLERDQAFVDQPVDDELNTIRTDLDTLKLQIAAGQDRPSAKIADLVARLERLVDETEEAVR